MGRTARIGDPCDPEIADMTARLDGRIALITGASSGIGAACAERFEREGARIAGLDIAPQPEGSPCEAWREVDVRDEQAVSQAITSLAESLGRIDILVNAAGVAGGGPAHELDQDEWDRVVDINLKGTFLVSKHVLARMVAQGSGNLVHLASVEGLMGLEGALPYNASKGGVVLMTRNMAIDYGRLGIRVNCICPGFIETPMTGLLREPGLEPIQKAITEAHMLGRMGQPQEVAAAAAFLASDDASFVSGHALVVDGGFTAGHRFGTSEVLASLAPEG